MDTLLLTRPRIEKTATSAAGIGIALCLLISQNLLISAKDIDVGNYTGLSPTLNYIKEEQANREKIFNQNISAKYSGSRITDVEKGVKYVRMIRYYNNSPVRINIVEVSTNVNSDLSIEPATASNTLAAR